MLGRWIFFVYHNSAVYFNCSSLLTVLFCVNLSNELSQTVSITSSEVCLQAVLPTLCLCHWIYGLFTVTFSTKAPSDKSRDFLDKPQPLSVEENRQYCPVSTRTGFPSTDTPLHASLSVEHMAVDTDTNEILTFSLSHHFTNKYTRNRSQDIVRNHLEIVQDQLTLLKWFHFSRFEHLSQSKHQFKIPIIHDFTLFSFERNLQAALTDYVSMLYYLKLSH